MLIRLRRDERGIALISALLISMVLVSLAVAVVSLSIHNSEQSANDRKRLQAINTAEAGLGATDLKSLASHLPSLMALHAALERDHLGTAAQRSQVAALEAAANDLLERCSDLARRCGIGATAETPLSLALKLERATALISEIESVLERQRRSVELRSEDDELAVTEAAHTALASRSARALEMQAALEARLNAALAASHLPPAASPA